MPNVTRKNVKDVGGDVGREPTFSNMETLLRDAAGYEPERDAPAGLVARAVARHQHRASRFYGRDSDARHGRALTLCGGAAAAAAAAVLVVALVGPPVRPGEPLRPVAERSAARATRDHPTGSAAPGPPAVPAAPAKTVASAAGTGAPPPVVGVHDERRRVAATRARRNSVPAGHRLGRGGTSAGPRPRIGRTRALTRRRPPRPVPAAPRARWEVQTVQVESYGVLAPVLLAQSEESETTLTPVVVDIPVYADTYAAAAGDVRPAAAEASDFETE